MEENQVPPSAEEEAEEIPVTYEETEELEPEAPVEVLGRLAAPSGIEAFDELKKTVSAWIRGEADAADTRSPWLAWDEDLAARYHFFEEGLRFQEWSEELIVRAREAFEQFEWIQEQMQRLDQAVSHGEPLEASYALEQMQLSVQQLQRVYAELESEQRAQPAYSESPLLAELMRVGKLAAEEKVPLESFEERLNVFTELQETMRLSLAVLPAAPRERAVLEQEQAALEEAFANQERGLASLREFLATQQGIDLEQGFEWLEQAAQVLNRVRDRLTGVMASAESLPCPFCSTVNARLTKFCSHCQARLPEIADSLMDVSAATESETLPTNLKKLGDAVEQRLAGQIDDAQFAEVLSWFRGLQTRAGQQLADVKPAASGTPDDQVELLERTRQAAADGLEQVESGLELMERYLEHSQDAQFLRSGWEQVLAGSHRLLELQPLFQQALPN